MFLLWQELRPVTHSEQVTVIVIIVLAKLFEGVPSPYGTCVDCGYLVLRYHYQVLSPPSVGALKWMFTFKVSLSSASPPSGVV